MHALFFHSITGGIASLLYTVAAIFVVYQERHGSSGGGWISLSGMASWLVTAPVSLPFELLGAKLDFRSNVHMAFAILVCAALVYGVGLGVEKGVRAFIASS